MKGKQRVTCSLILIGPSPVPTKNSFVNVNDGGVFLFMTDLFSEQNCDYELYAVVDHVGSLRGGHYTARIKSYDDHNWYVFDDSYVTQVCLFVN